ncbi:MAG: oligosaccharide flippase family protein [Arthrospira sp. SH-MAG29]|nr:oligosaccharide flippase family protein [Arthrospira sp. SH-MAG29]MBS0015741.1 oligosaccharide flippase family protein [Arthrospira sp. SH-MAG29]
MNFNKLKNKIVEIFKQPLFTGILWMLCSRFIGIFMQAGYFILIARTLGVNNFGIFMGISALAVILNPFSTLGSTDILIRDVSRNRLIFPESWANALLTTAVSGSCLITLALLTSLLIFPVSISPLAILFILASDLVGLAICSLCSGALISVNLLPKAAQLQIILNFSKLVAAILLAFAVETPNVGNWSILYFLANAATTLVSILLVNKMIGKPGKINLSKIKLNFNQGIYFSIGASADVVNSSIDKTMLASLGTPHATGLYAAAYRLIEVAYIPLLSIFSSTYAKFFEHGESGISGAIAFSKRLIPVVMAYGIIAFIGYWIFYPIVPYILGEEFQESIPVLLWLSPMPLLIGMQWMAGDTLAGSGHQKIRGFITLGTALFNVMINYLLIPVFSWKGATWATLASDTIKTIFLWGAVIFFYHQQVRQDDINNIT